MPRPDPARVLIRYVMAKEWPSKKVLNQYLLEHPSADKTKHWVKGDPKHKGKPGPQKPPRKSKSKAAPAKKETPPKSNPNVDAYLKDHPDMADFLKEHPDQVEWLTTPLKKNPGPQGRGEIRVKRYQYSKETVEKVLASRYDDDDDRGLTRRLMAALPDKKNETSYAVAWTYGWSAASEEDAIDEFMTLVDNEGSWANLKYSAVQTLIEAEKDKLIERGVMDKDGYVTLYRGVGPPQSNQIDEDRDSQYLGDDEEEEAHRQSSEYNLGVRRLSSWSESSDTAGKFANKDGDPGKVFKCKVHYSRIVNFWAAEDTSWRGEKEWTVMANDKEDAFIESTLVGGDSIRQASEKTEPKGKKKITLDDGNENWLRKMTLERLRKQGWKGTLKEYYEQHKGKKDK